MTCLRDQKLLDDVAAVRTRASKAFGVTVTPTFFVNGQRLERGATFEDFEKAFAPLREALTANGGEGIPDFIRLDLARHLLRYAWRAPGRSVRGHSSWACRGTVRAA